MCEPTTIALAAMAAGTAISAYSSYQTGQYNRAVAKENEKIQANSARDSLQRGANQAADAKENARRVAASQRAGAAAGGISVDSGSALDLLTETAGMGELDALTVRNNAQRAAYGYNVQAMNTKAQGRLARAHGNAQAASTLLTGASRMYGMQTTGA